jgi:hypothetical protein
VDELLLREPPRIPFESAEAEKIRNATAIVIDEVTMLRDDVFDHIDATIRSVMPASKRHLPFGGKAVLISGDWKQLLPVVEGAANERLEAVACCVKQSAVYHLFETLHLTQNMRVDPDQARWREFIYGVGTGRNYLTVNGRPTLLTEIPDEVCVDDLEQLMEFCFPQEALADPLRRKLAEHALSSRNTPYCPPIFQTRLSSPGMRSSRPPTSRSTPSTRRSSSGRGGSTRLLADETSHASTSPPTHPSV